MLHTLASLPRRLRWAMHRWTPNKDRDFHDALFKGQEYYPFTFAYPGYVTIRRFADLAAVRLEGVHRALDLGCGPGEITCELARRFPAIAFTGVDHSTAAIARAQEHARSLQLTNIQFETADIASYRPGERADVVMMFDAFHHLLDPAAFVRGWRDLTDRFVLVEPAGDWLGGWQKTIDLDWIPLAIDTMRARLVWQLGLPASPGMPSPPKNEHGDPVEHRYTVGDLQEFFAGFGLEIRGTVAGFETYPPDAFGHPPLRNEFGRIAYDVLAGVDDTLYLEDLDLHAKHWVVYAERGRPHKLRTPRAVKPRDDDSAHHVQGAYDIEYLAFDGPMETTPAAELLANITFRNRSWRTWTSAGETPIHASYHWLDAHGAVIEEDGMRTPLPRPVLAGENCTMSLRIRTPRTTGRYKLAIDMVEEGVTWFSRAGAATWQTAIAVRSGHKP